jgi:hypothetical protein
MEEEHVRSPFGEVYLIAFNWWDKNTNSLRGMLCNNSGPAACDFNTYSDSSLKWDGKAAHDRHAVPAERQDDAVARAGVRHHGDFIHASG